MAIKAAITSKILNPEPEQVKPEKPVQKKVVPVLAPKPKSAVALKLAELKARFVPSSELWNRVDEIERMV